MRYALALPLALLALSISPLLAKDKPQPQPVVPAASPAPDLAAQFATRFPRMLAVMEADFPAERETLLSLPSEAPAAAEIRGDALGPVFARLLEIRRTYAARLRFASTPSLQTALLRLADFHSKVFEREGAEICGHFAMDGAGVLFDRGLAARYAADLDVQGSAFFSAVATALERPRYVEEATQADWDAVGRTMVSAGAPFEFIAVIARSDPTEPDLCPALAAFIRATAEQGGEEGVRARASFAQQIAGY